MKIQSLIVTSAFLVTVLDVSGAGEKYGIGGRSAGMANSTVTLSDFWSIHNNPAGIAWNSHIMAGISAFSPFAVRDIAGSFVGLAVPAGIGCFGLSLNRFGTKMYHELGVRGSFARKFGKKTSGGVAVDYLYMGQGNQYGSKGFVTCQLGFQYDPEGTFSAGVAIANPYPISIDKSQNDFLITTFTAGIKYRFSRDYEMSCEIEKGSNSSPVIRTGAEYHISDHFLARVGVASTPLIFAFGIGMIIGNLNIDIAASYHQALGFTPGCSLLYTMKKRGT